MSDYIEFVKKEKWCIRFVPWKKSPTGIMVGLKPDEQMSVDQLCVIGLTMDEGKEFTLDLMKASIERFDVEFPNDDKAPRTKKQLVEKYLEIIEAMKNKRLRSPFYIS